MDQEDNSKMAATEDIWNPIPNKEDDSVSQESSLSIDDWELHFDALREYMCMDYPNGGFVPSDRYFPELGDWISQQREHYRGKCLSEKRIQKLQDIGFWWEEKNTVKEIAKYVPPDVAVGTQQKEPERKKQGPSRKSKEWMRLFEELKSHTESLRPNGGTVLCSKFPDELWCWIQEQRRLYWEKKEYSGYGGNPTISDDHIQKLEEIGFPWTPQKRATSLSVSHQAQRKQAVISESDGEMQSVTQNQASKSCPSTLQDMFMSDFKNQLKAPSKGYSRKMVSRLWNQTPAEVKQSMPAAAGDNAEQQLREWKVKYFGERTLCPLAVRGCPDKLVPLLREDFVHDTGLSRKEITLKLNSVWRNVSKSAKNDLPQETSDQNYFSELKKWKVQHLPDAADEAAAEPSQRKRSRKQHLNRKQCPIAKKQKTSKFLWEKPEESVHNESCSSDGDSTTGWLTQEEDLNESHCSNLGSSGEDDYQYTGGRSAGESSDAKHSTKDGDSKPATSKTQPKYNYDREIRKNLRQIGIFYEKTESCLEKKALAQATRGEENQILRKKVKWLEKKIQILTRKLVGTGGQKQRYHCLLVAHRLERKRRIEAEDKLEQLRS